MTAHRLVSTKCSLASLPRYFAEHRRCADSRCGCTCHRPSAEAASFTTPTEVAR